jgi:hypothetical protein
VVLGWRGRALVVGGSGLTVVRLFRLGGVVGAMGYAFYAFHITPGEYRTCATRARNRGVVERRDKQDKQWYVVHH